MNQEILIRLAEPADVLTIVDFNRRMAEETENKQLPIEIIMAGVNAIFSQPNERMGFYVIAETESKEIVGCLLVTFEWSDWRDGLFWWIQSVYVRADFRRKGVYRKLYEWIRAEAKRRDNVRGFRLYVEKENIVAQSVYEKLGMSETCYKMYEELL